MRPEEVPGAAKDEGVPEGERTEGREERRFVEWMLEASKNDSHFHNAIVVSEIWALP